MEQDKTAVALKTAMTAFLGTSCISAFTMGSAAFTGEDLEAVNGQIASLESVREVSITSTRIDIYAHKGREGGAFQQAVVQVLEGIFHVTSLGRY